MRTVIYAAFIGDGYALPESPHDADDTTPEGSAYWYSLRNAEVDCPRCNAGTEPPGPVECEDCGGSGAEGDVEGRPECYECRGKGTVTKPCPTCEGSGHVRGEPFTVTRYTFPTEELAAECYAACEDASDGYDRARVLETYANKPGVQSIDVLEWSPDYL